MRNFKMMPSVPGPPAAFADAEGEGPGYLVTVSPGGAVMEPLYPSYSNDEYGATKNDYKVVRSGGSQGTLYAAGR